MFGAEGVGWRGLGRDAAPPAAAAAALRGVLPAALLRARRGRWPARRAEVGRRVPSHSPGAGRLGDGMAEGQAPSEIRRRRHTRLCVLGARFRSPRGLAFSVAKRRVAESCAGVPSSRSQELLARDRPLAWGPPGSLRSAGPGASHFSQEGGARRAPPYPFLPGTLDRGDWG